MPETNPPIYQEISPTPTQHTPQSVIPPSNPPLGHIATPPQRDFIWYIIITILLIIAVGLGFYIYQLQQNLNKLEQANVTKPVTPSPAVTTATVPSNEYQPLVYLDEKSNVVLYDPNSDTLKQITTAANQPLIWHAHPVFVNKEKVAYQQCSRKGTEQTDPYTCEIFVYTLASGQSISVFTAESTANQNGYHIGGELLTMTANPTGEFLVMVHSSYQGENDTSATIIDLSTRSHDTFATFARNPGRGGSLTDDHALEYSPDGKYLLLTLITFLPSQEESSMRLYAAESLAVREIWRSPVGDWWTYGRWLDTSTFTAQRTPNAQSAQNQTAELVAITAFDQKETILNTDVSNWYDVQPISPDEVSYFTINKVPGSGISLWKFNTNSKENTLIMDNVKPLAVSKNAIYVFTMNKCPIDCGMDIFNGYEHGGFGILDLNTSQLISKPVTPNIGFVRILKEY